MQEVYLFAVGANLCFALGSQVYTLFSRKVGSAWMNLFKAAVAFVLFGVTVTFVTGWNPVSPMYIGLLIFSGMIGLGVGDVFLLRSFSEMGPGRTLMLFGFQPLILGTIGYVIFDQHVDFKKFWAITLFILCILTFSIEAFRRDGHWGVKGILMALTGMLLDATGIIFTRLAFDNNPQMGLSKEIFIAALERLWFLSSGINLGTLNFFSNFKKLENKQKWLAIVGSILGTYFSLGLYLMALQKAHLPLFQELLLLEQFLVRPLSVLLPVGGQVST